jgi:FkbM family methyltransferase
MSNIYNILHYIFNKNSYMDIPKYLVYGTAFQLFKRMTNNVISKEIFNGKKIYLYPKCNVSTMFAYTEIPDQREVMSLRELAESEDLKSMVFIDIGANIGSYSVSMMDVCKEVIAFEPHPYTANRCKMNYLLNNVSEKKVYQLALSNEIGRMYFSDYGNSSTVNHISNDKNGIEVEVTTLDSFVVKNKLSKKEKYILKVDVEGFERQVFEGGKEFLVNYDVKGIIFECFSQDDVFLLLKKYGYENIKKISENNYLATKCLMDRVVEISKKGLYLD